MATLLTSAHLLTYLESRVTSDISCPLSQTLDDTLDSAPLACWGPSVSQVMYGGVHAFASYHSFR
jgi:hypothetical protein